MDAATLLPLVDALGHEGGRQRASETLAQLFGADALFVFVPDPGHPKKLLPARGFRPLPGMRGWRELLLRCAQPGTHCGDVAFPDADHQRPACAYAFDGIAYVAIGHDSPRDDVREALGAIARVTSTMLRSELGLAIVRGELISERQSAERAHNLAHALDRARADAERATRVKDEFLAMLGHELRNPLAPIVTALQLLRMQNIHTRPQDVLERQVQHMMRLVDDLLDVARITSGKVELRKENLEIAAAIGRAVEMARPLLEQRRNKLTIAVPERGLVVDGDPARLAQIFANLITNAAKYSNPESAIEVRAEQHGACVRIVVVDNGVGLDPAYIDRVFDQFVQVPQGSDRQAGGLGLGLAIVRNLVDGHGGSVRAVSAGLGCGSTFTVELPLALHEPRSQRPIAPLHEAGETGIRGFRVCVVDDNADAATLLSELLRTSGLEVDVAHSGPDALAMLETRRPDAAILDIGLPVMDGYELARKMRTREPTIKLVALTGYGSANDRDRAREAGFDAHLVKPVTVANVTRTLNDLLRA